MDLVPHTKAAHRWAAADSMLWQEEMAAAKPAKSLVRTLISDAGSVINLLSIAAVDAHQVTWCCIQKLRGHSGDEQSSL
jgi:hypothetical protein